MVFPRSFYLSNLSGGLLLAIAGLGLGWLPPLFNTSVNPILDYLRNNDFGNFLSRVALVTGAALILHLWLNIGRKILKENSYRTRELMPFIHIPVLFLFFTPPMFSRDVYSYMAQARLSLRGLNPYDYGVGWLPGWFQLGADPMWVDTPTPYGPLAIWIGEFFELLIPNSPYSALLLHRAVAVLGVYLAIYAITKIALKRDLNATAAIWLFGLNPLILFHFISAAHNDSLMVGLLMIGFLFALKNRGALAVTALILAAAIKPIALLAAPFLVVTYCKPEWPAILKNWLIGAIATIGGLVGIGQLTGLGIGWVFALTAPTSVRTLLSPVTLAGETVGRPLEFLSIVSADLVVQVFQILGLLVAVIIVVFLIGTIRVRSGIRGAALAYAAVVLLSPVIQPWYLLWVLGILVAAGINHAWHFKAIILGTVGFVAFSTIEVNMVLDSALSFSDLISVVISLLAVVLVIWASPEERELLLGEHLNQSLSNQPKKQST
jgi:alpha-1,6-mannosyltransferase